MITLPKTRSLAAFALTQVFRQGKIAIFEQRSLVPDRVMAYEVVRIRERPANPAFGVAEPYESYPSPEGWGRDAFTCLSLADARRQAAAMAG